MAIQLSDSIFVGQQKPVEDKYYNGLSPYSSTSDVNTTLASAIRYRGLTVNVNGVEYWYKDGIADTDLVAKATGGGGGGAIEIQDQGITVDSATAIINFTGAGVTASGPGTGTVTVDIPGGLSTPYHLIDLSGGNYTITVVGQYEIKQGASTTNKIIFPDPAGVNNGDKITIVNRDITNFYKAPLDDTYSIFFQGNNLSVHAQGGAGLDILAKVLEVPSGMTYVFEAVQSGAGGSNSYWMCYAINVEPFYDGIILYDGSTSTDYPLYIQNHGTYNIIRGSQTKGSVIYFPDPKDHIGKKITISVLFGEMAEIDDSFLPYHANYFVNLTGANYPQPVQYLNGGGIYTFMAVPSVEYSTCYWSCISTHPPVLPTIQIDLSLISPNNFQIVASGIYSIFAIGSGGISLNVLTPGQRITIINTVNSNVSFVGAQAVKTASGGSYGAIPGYKTVEIVSDFNNDLRLLYEY